MERMPMIKTDNKTLLSDGKISSEIVKKLNEDHNNKINVNISKIRTENNWL